MHVIDAQLHEPPMSLAWAGADQQMRWDLMLEVQLAYMAAVGVDRALLLPAEPDWGSYVVSRMPERFALVRMIGNPAYGGIDPADPAMTDRLAQLRKDGVVAIRILKGTDPDWLESRLPAIDACAEVGIPIFLTATGDLDAVTTVAERHPAMTIILDHLGLPQSPGEVVEDPPFRSLPKVLALAAHPNVSVKLTSAVALSREAFPFDDLWPHLHELLDAFGPERLMWGSDFSRFVGRIGFTTRIPGTDGDYRPNHSYAEALFYLRGSDQVSAQAKAWLLGEPSNDSWAGPCRRAGAVPASTPLQPPSTVKTKGTT